MSGGGNATRSLTDRAVASIRFTAARAASRSRAFAGSLSSRLKSGRIPQTLFDKLAVVWLIAQTMQAPSVYWSALAGCIRLHPNENGDDLHRDVLRAEPSVRKAADAVMDALYPKQDAGKSDIYFGILKELTHVLQTHAKTKRKQFAGFLGRRLMRRRSLEPLGRLEACEKHLQEAVRIVLSRRLDQLIAGQNRGRPQA
jgi:hypothetical protein